MSWIYLPVGIHLPQLCHVPDTLKPEILFTSLIFGSRRFPSSFDCISDGCFLCSIVGDALSETCSADVM